jgi:hypothetical protein
MGIALNTRKIPLPILLSVNCQMPVAIISPAIISLIFLWNIAGLFKITNIVKWIENNFTKGLWEKKSLYICTGFRITVIQN